MSMERRTSAIPYRKNGAGATPVVTVPMMHVRTMEMATLPHDAVQLVHKRTARVLQWDTFFKELKRVDEAKQKTQKEAEEIVTMSRLDLEPQLLKEFLNPSKQVQASLHRKQHA